MIYVPEVAGNLREEDATELFAMHGHDSYEVVLGRAVVTSEKCWTIMYGLDPVGMFGVCSTIEAHIGVPWLLGTPELEKHYYEFLKQCKPYVKALGKGYTLLMNYVHHKNYKAKRWLKWLGFELSTDCINLGAYQEPFQLFTKYTHV